MQCEPWKPCCCYRCFLSALLWKKKISACGSCLTERDLIQINNRPVVGKHSITLERAEVERLKFFFSLFRVLFCFLNWDSCLHSSSLLTSHLPVCWFTCWLLHVVTCYIVGYMYASETVIKVCWKSLQVRKAKNLYTTIKDLVPFAQNYTCLCHKTPHTNTHTLIALKANYKVLTTLRQPEESVCFNKYGINSLNVKLILLLKNKWY